jgi:hypothetical protein
MGVPQKFLAHSEYQHAQDHQSNDEKDYKDAQNVDDFPQTVNGHSAYFDRSSVEEL